MEFEDNTILSTFGRYKCNVLIESFNTSKCVFNDYFVL